MADEMNRFGESRKNLRVLDLCRDFGWNDGFAVPIHGPHDYHGLVAFAGNPTSLGESERTALHMLAFYAHERLLALHESDREGRRIMAVRAAGLSERQCEALRLLATGLTDREVAEKLGVAERTGLYYVQSARRKLGCRTRAQLMVEVTRLGLLT